MRVMYWTTNKELRARMPPVSHPMVRTHAVTGRQALFVSGYAIGVEGVPEDEGRAIVDEVLAFATQTRFVYRHVWRSGDVVFWDERCTIHMPMPADPSYPRHIQRTQIAGEEPFYHA